MVARLGREMEVRHGFLVIQLLSLVFGDSAARLPLLVLLARRWGWRGFFIRYCLSNMIS
jgi:hypothetical protein